MEKFNPDCVSRVTTSISGEPEKVVCPSRTVYCPEGFPQTILSSEKIGFALRPGVFSLQEIKETALVLETSGRVSSVFVPDHRIWYESLKIVSSILTLTQRLHPQTVVLPFLYPD